MVTLLYHNPEVAFQECRSSALLAARLREAQFEMAHRIAGLDTAFVATQEGTAPGNTIAVIAEYDALPGPAHVRQPDELRPRRQRQAAVPEEILPAGKDESAARALVRQQRAALRADVMRFRVERAASH